MRRLALPVLVLVGALPLALAMALPAGAAGAGGIEVTPLTESGRAATAFHVKTGGRDSGTIAFEVRNVGTAPASARIFAASVTRTGSAYAVAGPGSAPWIRLAPETVRLAPGERRRFDAEIAGRSAPKGSVAYGAVVEEPVQDSAVVRRVATLVYLERSAPSPVPRPVVLLVVATLLLGGAAVLVTRQARLAA